MVLNSKHAQYLGGEVGSKEKKEGKNKEEEGQNKGGHNSKLTITIKHNTIT